MASNRRTAFARTPRANNTDPNIGSGPVTRIDKRFLDSLTQARLGPDISTIMTKSNTELAINVQSNGKGNYTLQNQGRVVADSADIQKVQALGTFINDERKAVLKSSVSGNTKQTLAAILSVSREPAYNDIIVAPIQRFSKGFVDVFRGLNSQADMLAVNLTAIGAIPAEGEANQQVRNHLLATGARIREALGEYLLYRASTADGETLQKLNDFLLTKKVIAWVFTRLTAQKLQLSTADFEYRRIYFPKDPTKGLCLSFQELNNEALVTNQGEVLQGIKAMKTIWSEQCIRTFCNFPAGEVTDFSQDSPAKVFKNIPMMVVPFLGAVKQEEIFTALGKTADRGMAWSVGSTVSPQDNLRFLGTLPKRLFYALLPRPVHRVDMLARVFPGFIFDPQSEVRSVYAQLLAYTKTLEENFSFDWFRLVTGETKMDASGVSKLTMMSAVIMDCAGNDAYTRILRDSYREAKSDLPRGVVSNERDIWSAIISAKNGLSREQATANLQGILDVDLGPRNKKNNRENDVRSARSPITPAGNSLIRELKRRGYTELSTRVDRWLRSFLSAEVQSPVAEVIHARLEASLNTPVHFTAQDRIGFVEPDEFETQPDGDPVDEHMSDVEDADNNPDEN